MGQGFGRLGHQRRQQRHAQTHIAGFDDHGMARRRLDAFFVSSGKPRGADDMDNPGLGGQVGQHDRDHGPGEINHALGMRQQGERIGGELDAIGLLAGEGAGIHAQIGMAFDFQRADQRHALALADFAHQGAAHAARRACHHDV